MTPDVEYIFQCSTTELEDFFNNKVWKIDILGLYKDALRDMKEYVSEQYGPEGAELARVRGKIVQTIGLLDMEAYVLDKKKQQLQESKEESNEDG